MANRVWPVNAQSGAPQYSGRMLRQASIAPMVAGATAGRPLGARSGVRPGTPPTTVTATQTTWTANPHAGILDLQAAAEAGPYGYALDTTVTGPVTAASASIARVDIVWVRIDDPSESDGSSAPGVVVGYTAGTVASTPPPTPARSMVLAEINVPASGNGAPTVTWVAPPAVTAGSFIRVRNDAERLALGTGTALDPLLVRQGNTGVYWEHAGAGWRYVAGQQLRSKYAASKAGGDILTTPGAFGLVSAESTATLATPGPEGVLTITEAGLYLVSVVGTLGAPAAGPSSLRVETANESLMYGQASIPLGYGYGSVSFTDYLAAGATIKVQIDKRTGSTSHVMAARVTLVRLS